MVKIEEIKVISEEEFNFEEKINEAIRMGWIPIFETFKKV